MPSFMRVFRRGNPKRAISPTTGYVDTESPRADAYASVDAAACARSVTKIVAFAEAQSARVIGLTSNRVGVGVSLIADQVAATYGHFGKKVVVLDASGLNLDQEGRDSYNASAHTINLKDVSVPLGPNVAYVDIASVSSCFPDRDCFRRALDLVISEYDIAIIDLPTVSLPSGWPNTTFLTSGAACNLVFLVCLTGSIKREELNDCLETCRIGGVKIGGIVLSDWKLPGSKLLSG